MEEMLDEKCKYCSTGEDLIYFCDPICTDCYFYKVSMGEIDEEGDEICLEE